MEKNVLKSLTRILLLLLFVFVSCVSIKVRQKQRLQQTYSTTLPSGKEFSVTFNDADSTFEETNCAGCFRGIYLFYEDSTGKFKGPANVNDKQNIYIYCHSFFNDSLSKEYDGSYLPPDMYYSYLPISNSDRPEVKLYDRDCRELDIYSLLFIGDNEEVLYSYRQYSEQGTCINSKIPSTTKEIEIEAYKSRNIGRCEYNDSLGDVYFYTVANFSKPSYWLKNSDSLYYIPFDVKKGDTANYLFLPRVK